MIDDFGGGGRGRRLLHAQRSFSNLATRKDSERKPFPFKQRLIPFAASEALSHSRTRPRSP